MLLSVSIRVRFGEKHRGITRWISFLGAATRRIYLVMVYTYNEATILTADSE